MLDEYDEHYSGLYIVGDNDDLDIPLLVTAQSSVSGVTAANIEALSNKTANDGFFKLVPGIGGAASSGPPENKRSFSPAFKI